MMTADEACRTLLDSFDVFTAFLLPEAISPHAILPANERTSQPASTHPTCLSAFRRVRALRPLSRLPPRSAARSQKVLHRYTRRSRAKPRTAAVAKASLDWVPPDYDPYGGWRAWPRRRGRHLVRPDGLTTFPLEQHQLGVAGATCDHSSRAGRVHNRRTHRRASLRCKRARDRGVGLRSWPVASRHVQRAQHRREIIILRPAAVGDGGGRRFCSAPAHVELLQRLQRPRACPWM